jgi:hypothetical protein
MIPEDHFKREEELNVPLTFIYHGKKKRFILIRQIILKKDLV